MSNDRWPFLQYLPHLNAIPPTLFLVVGIVCALLFLGWRRSIRAAHRASKHKGLHLAFRFPLTNPIALPFIAKREPGAVMASTLCYLLALLLVPLGSRYAEKLERQELAKHTETLQNDSPAQSPIDPKSKTESSEANVWDHPFLKPIAATLSQFPSNKTLAPDQLSNQLQDPFQPLFLPDSTWRFRGILTIKPDSAADTAYIGNAREVLSTSNAIIDQIPGSQSEDQDTESWVATAKIITDYFQSTNEQTEALEAALNRPNDAFPYDDTTLFKTVILFQTLQ